MFGKWKSVFQVDEDILSDCSSVVCKKMFDSEKEERVATPLLVKTLDDPTSSSKYSPIVEKINNLSDFRKLLEDFTDFWDTLIGKLATSVTTRQYRSHLSKFSIDFGGIFYPNIIKKTKTLGQLRTDNNDRKGMLDSTCMAVISIVRRFGLQISKCREKFKSEPNRFS